VSVKSDSTVEFFVLCSEYMAVSLTRSDDALCIQKLYHKTSTKIPLPRLC